MQLQHFNELKRWGVESLHYVTDKAATLGPSPTQDTVKIDTTSPSSVRPQWSSDVTSTSVDPFWPNSVILVRHRLLQSKIYRYQQQYGFQHYNQCNFLF